MLIELEQSNFSRCKDIINPTGHLEVRAIMAGNNPGRVFVDNEEKPSAGLVWLGNHDGFFFFGEKRNEEFNQKVTGFIDRVIAPQAQELNLEWFECFGNHPGWDETIETIFSGRDMQTWNQKVFSLPGDQRTVSISACLPAEFSLLRIVPGNLSSEISNLPFWGKRICDFWGDLERFFELGIGYGILREKELVGLCFSGFVEGDVHGIDIETLPAYQGKKLGQIMGSAFVEDCQARNLTPYWDCMESNKPSEAVARKIGLVESFSYRGFEFAL